MSTKMYAIAVESFPQDSKGDQIGRYKTRYWGAGDCTYLWASKQQAEDYMNDLNDDFFHDKTAVIDDVRIAHVDRDEIEGEIIEPSWTEPKYSDEGYDTPMILEEVSE